MITSVIEIVIIKGFYPLDIAKVIRLSDRTFFIGVYKASQRIVIILRCVGDIFNNNIFFN
jgi:hypothetical protein